MQNYAASINRRAGDADSAPYIRPNQLYRAILFVAVVLTTYLSVPLVAGGLLLVPSFPTVLLMPLLLLATWPSISSNDILFVLKVAFVLLVSIALSPGIEHANQKFLGLVQFCLAFTVAVALVRLVQQIRGPLLERSLLLLWLLVVGGCVLEIVDVIRGVSDSFREWAYANTYNLYDGIDRDMNMVGWLRPKLFSVEPSHVTKLFVATVNAWLLVRVTWPKVWIVVGATLAMLIIMGSPMLLVSAAITLAIVVWNRNAKMHTKVAMVCASVLITLLFGLYYGASRYEGVAGRLSKLDEPVPMQGARMGSEEDRVVYPYMVLMEIWSRWPFFGVGISGKEVVLEQSEFKFRDPDAAIGSNAFAEAGIYLGIFGGLWLVSVMVRGARGTGVQRLMLMAVIVALFSQLMGGVVSFRYWGYVALLWGALAIADRREKGNIQFGNAQADTDPKTGPALGRSFNTSSN